MTKKRNQSQPKATSTRYKVGDEFLYHNNRDVVDRVSIKEIIPGGYLLSNNIRMNDSLKRIDQDAKKYDYQILPWDKDSERLHDTYYAHCYLLRKLNELERDLLRNKPFQMGAEDQERVIRIYKKFRRAIEK